MENSGFGHDIQFRKETKKNYIDFLINYQVNLWTYQMLKPSSRYIQLFRHLVSLYKSTSPNNNFLDLVHYSDRLSNSIEAYQYIFLLF